MAQRHLDLVHVHPTWEPRIKPEYSEEGRLHRHRLIEPGRQVRFTSWAHNTPAHQHRLPDGAFTRPRLDLNPPTWLLAPKPTDAPAAAEHQTQSSPPARPPKRRLIPPKAEPQGVTHATA